MAMDQATMGALRASKTLVEHLRKMSEVGLLEISAEELTAHATARLLTAAEDALRDCDVFPLPYIEAV